MNLQSNAAYFMLFASFLFGGAWVTESFCFRGISFNTMVKPNFVDKPNSKASSLKPLLMAVDSEQHEADGLQQLFQSGTEWGGRPEILIRRKEFPQEGQSPQDVVRLILNRLQINDDPQLDHGAAVAVKFASPTNFASKLNPKEYGNFLRNSDDFEMLLDASGFKILGPIKLSEDGNRAVQSAVVRGPPPSYEQKKYNVALSKNEGMWLVDSILLSD